MLLSKLVEYDATNGAGAITGFPILVPEAELVTQPAEQKNAGSDEPIEMLTIKECTELVKGLSSNTIRKLIARGELDYVRAGCGNNGKILISKANLPYGLQKFEHCRNCQGRGRIAAGCLVHFHKYSQKAKNV